MSGSLVSINGHEAAIWTLYDITEKKLLEDKLKESEELLKTLVDNLPISIGMHKDKYIYVNPEFTNMFGYSEQEAKGMDVLEVDAEEYRENAKERIMRGLTEMNVKYDVIIQGINKSGERLWMHVYTNSAKYKGETVRIASFLDITEQEKLKSALQKSLDHNKKLTRFNIMLKSANQIIAKAKDEKKLFNEICYIARQYSGIRLVWIGKPYEDGRYKVLAKSGEIGYLEGAVISAREDLPEGQGVMGQVWRNKKQPKT